MTKRQAVDIDGKTGRVISLPPPKKSDTAPSWTLFRMYAARWRRSKREILAAVGREKYNETVGRPSKESLSIVGNDLPKHNTRTEIAKDLGWSTGKVAMAEIRGSISLMAVYLAVY